MAHSICHETPTTKQLSGPDGTTVAAMNGFNHLQTVAQKYDTRYVKNSLEKRKRYLKSRYEMNYNSTYSSVSSHCVPLPLSNTAANSLQEIVEIEKNNICQDCHDLHNATADVYDSVKENLNDQSTVYDINIAVKDILQYIKYLVCDVQQRIAKTHAFANLNEETVLWLRGYCKKVISVRFHEGWKEYFGKKGMSLHIDVFSIKKNRILHKQVYFTASYRCDQGSVDTLRIADIVINSQFMLKLCNFYAKVKALN